MKKLNKIVKISIILDKDDDIKKAVSASLGIVTADGHIAALAKVRIKPVIHLVEYFLRFTVPLRF